MGRAQGRAAPAPTSGFESALGRRRGSGEHTLASETPTPEGQRLLNGFERQLQAGEFEDSQRILTAERNRILSAPLLRELAGQFHYEIFNASRFANVPVLAQAAMVLEDAGWRDSLRSDTVLRDSEGTLHLWSAGNTHGPDVLKERSFGAETRNPFSHSPFGRTVCGMTVDGAELSRAVRGAWARAEDEVPDPDADPELERPALCPGCAAGKHAFADCDEIYPSALLGPGGDEPLRSAFRHDPASADLLATALGEESGIFGLHTRLAGNYQRVFCNKLGDEMAAAPGLRIFHMLGHEGPTVLQKLRNAKVKPAGLLSAGDFSALLAEHWPLPGPEDRRKAFEQDLTKAIYAAAAQRVRARRTAS